VISKKIAYKRDNGQCRVCHSRAVDIHHIVYRSHGGNDDERNLICLCRSCHEKAHSDEKTWRDRLLSMQSIIYGEIKKNDLKHDKWRNYKIGIIKY